MNITTTVKLVYPGHLGTHNTVLIMEVSLFQKFINTHNCTATNCPDL